MNVVFLDTVGLIALWDKSDQWHLAATQAMLLLKLPHTRLLTTSLVLLECGNSAARKPYRKDVDDLRRNLLRQGNLIIPTEQDIAAAWDIYRIGKPSTAGIVDLVSFYVMRIAGVTEAFTNDKHFKAAGFNLLF